MSARSPEQLQSKLVLIAMDWVREVADFSRASVADIAIRINCCSWRCKGRMGARPGERGYFSAIKVNCPGSFEGAIENDILSSNPSIALIRKTR